MSDQIPEWLQQVEDESLRPRLAKFKTPGDLGKSYAELEARMGRSVVLPDADSPAEDIVKAIGKIQELDPRIVRLPADDDEEGAKAFWASLGVPEDGYKPPEDFEGIPDDALKMLTDYADANRLTKKQYQGLLDWAKSLGEGATKQYEEAQEADRAALKARLGTAVDEVTERNAQLAAHFADPKFPVPDASPGAWFDLLMKNIGDAMSGKGQQAPFQPKPRGGLTPEEAGEEAKNLFRKLQGNSHTMTAEERKRMGKRYVELIGLANQR